MTNSFMSYERKTFITNTKHKWKEKLTKIKFRVMLHSIEQQPQNV